MKKLLIIISLIIGLVSCVSKRKDLPQYKVEYSKELVIKSIDRGLNSYGVLVLFITSLGTKLVLMEILD